MARKNYQKLVKMAKRDSRLTQTHSIEEAETRHKAKPARKSEK